jgi:hypothetical protein
MPAVQPQVLAAADTAKPHPFYAAAASHGTSLREAVLAALPQQLHMANASPLPPAEVPAGSGAALGPSLLQKKLKASAVTAADSHSLEHWASSAGHSQELIAAFHGGRGSGSSLSLLGSSVEHSNSDNSSAVQGIAELSTHCSSGGGATPKSPLGQHMHRQEDWAAGGLLQAPQEATPVEPLGAGGQAAASATTTAGQQQQEAWRAQLLSSLSSDQPAAKAAIAAQGTAVQHEHPTGAYNFDARLAMTPGTSLTHPQQQSAVPDSLQQWLPGDASLQQVLAQRRTRTRTSETLPSSVCLPQVSKDENVGGSSSLWRQRLTPELARMRSTGCAAGSEAAAYGLTAGQQAAEAVASSSANADEVATATAQAAPVGATAGADHQPCDAGDVELAMLAK